MFIDNAEVHAGDAGGVYSCWIEGQRFDVPLAHLVQQYWQHDADGLHGCAVASELVHDLGQEHRAGVIDAIAALAEAVSGETDALGFLGAGVLEDMLRCCRAPPTAALVDALEAAVRRSPDLRTAIGWMWLHDADPDRLQFQRLGRRIED